MRSGWCRARHGNIRTAPHKNSVQKTICCNSTPSASDDGRVYPKHVELNNTLIKLPCCIKLAFQIISVLKFFIDQRFISYCCASCKEKLKKNEQIFRNGKGATAEIHNIEQHKIYHHFLTHNELNDVKKVYYLTFFSANGIHKECERRTHKRLTYSA